MKYIILLTVLSISFLATLNGCTGKTNGNETDNQTIVTDDNGNEIKNQNTNSINNDGGEVYILTALEFKEKIFNYETNKEWKYLGTKPVVVDFYADWCKPCKMVAPIMDELAKSYGENIIFYKVNVDNEQELANVFGVSSIPSILFVPGDGSQPQIATGAMAKDEYIKVISEILKISL
jgi:thioredoxin